MRTIAGVPDNESNRQTLPLRLLVAVITTCVLWLAHPARAGTNFTDLWWNPSESGWGVTMSQDYNGPIFATFFVYASDGKPTWVAALLALDTATGSYTGAIIETNGGASFSNQNFDPTAVQVNDAGSATFTPMDAANGTLAYTYRGVSVVKRITRQSLYTPDTNSNATFLTFTPGGTAYRAIVESRNNGHCSINNSGGTYRIFPTGVTGTAITMNIGNCDASVPNGCVISTPSCTFAGTIQTTGALMNVAGTLSCSTATGFTGGLTGAFAATFSEVAHTDAGVNGKLNVSNNACNVQSIFLIQRNDWLNKVVF